jgi:hypothetical protein
MSKFNALYQGDEGYDQANFKVGIHGVGDPAGHFVSNGLRFNTSADAQGYAEDLARRWFGMDEWRVETLDGEISVQLEY